MAFQNNPSTSPAADYLFKQKDPVTGKNMIVGRGWKKKSQYGDFVSVSIGKGPDAQKFIMVKADDKFGANSTTQSSTHGAGLGQRNIARPASAPSSQQSGQQPGPKMLSEEEWRALEQAAKGGPSGPDTMPDDSIDF